MKVRGRLVSGWLAGLLGWLVLGFWIAPALIEEAYRRQLVPEDAPSVEFILEQCYQITILAPLAAAAVMAFSRIVQSSRWSRRLVPDARPSDLGAIRILVCGILLISILWEDLASTAAIPRGLIAPPGVMHLFYLLPLGFERFAASPTALRIFEWLTAIVLLFGLIGWKTKLMLPFGAAMYLIAGGLLRQYSWFYHTGLLPLYLLIVLSALPLRHGWSVDQWLRSRRNVPVPSDDPSRAYGWARYALWTALAVPYVAAGLSKLRNGGLHWWDASNFKYILLHSTLRPMEFDFEWSLSLVTAPDVVIEAVAITAVLGELFYGLVLFSRRARWILPPVMLLMHVSILFLQNILFFDLILLQGIYLNFRPALAKAGRPDTLRRWFGKTDRHQRHKIAVDAKMVGEPLAMRWPYRAHPRFVVVGIVALLAACWVFRVEFYPLTGMQMFSDRRSEPVVYELAHAQTSSGTTMRAPIEKSIGAMADSRYRRILGMSFDPERAHLSRAFMDSVAARWNARVQEGDRIVRIVVERWAWNYLTEPDSPTNGRLVDSVTYDFASPSGQ